MRQEENKQRPFFQMFTAETITRHDDTPYLWRLRLFDCRWFGVYLHRFLSPDDLCLHDHPWPFISIVLWGGYWEAVGENWRMAWGQENHQGFVDIKRRWHWPGSILFRPAHHAHRIDFDERQKFRPWTLVIRGQVCRKWGFFTRFGWKWWRNYTHAEHCS